jgi:hypothetical protein
MVYGVTVVYRIYALSAHLSIVNNFLKLNKYLAGYVAHTCNPNYTEGRDGKMAVLGQLHKVSETLSQKAS